MSHPARPARAGSRSPSSPGGFLAFSALRSQDFERSRAFTFLNEIKKRFQTTYGSRAQTALPYAMNSEFSSVLAAQLVRLQALPCQPSFPRDPPGVGLGGLRCPLG